MHAWRFAVPTSRSASGRRFVRSRPDRHRPDGAIAKKLGAPATAQDVAAACAANRHAVAIPCHRIIKADGSISGYRWGVARKRALLAHERF